MKFIGGCTLALGQRNSLGSQLVMGYTLSRRRLRAKLYELLRKSEPELHLESAGIVTVGCVRRYSWIRGRSKEQYISTINPITRRQATRVKYVAGVLAEVTSIHLLLVHDGIEIINALFGFNHRGNKL